MTTADPPVGASPHLVTPSQPGWDDARRAWNLAADQRPEVVAMPESAEEVAAAVRMATERGLRVAVQATGHGAGAHPGHEGTLLVNMARMRGVEVDAPTRRARVQAGAIWQEVVDAAAPHGLTALHGSAHDVGVAGYTLGGGLGWLARRHGLACNAVRAIELVSAAGELRRIDADSDPDLFWALRGGGGGFGVVTALEFDLFPVAEVYAGWLMWPWERTVDVLGRWSELCPGLSEEVTSVGRLLQLPELPELPEALRGAQLVPVEACCMGERAAAEEALAPLRALDPMMDTFDVVPAAALTTLHMDPPEPVPGIGDGGLLDTFSGDAVGALAEAAGPGSGSPLLSVEVRHLGGALGRASEDAGALARLDGEFSLFAVGLPMTPEMGAAIPAHIDRVLASLAPAGFGRRYLNFAERSFDAGSAFPSATRDRLVAIRERVDPRRILSPNHDVGGPGGAPR